MSADDPWAALRARTRARIGLGRAGDALPTRAQLALQWAHAKARDAIQGVVNFDAIAEQIAPRPTFTVHSEAPNRDTYLRRPDLGRQLDEHSRTRLPSGPFDLVFVIADGLSAEAVQQHAAPTLIETCKLLSGVRIGPVILAEQARVAIGDQIGALMQARLVIVLIGERPGLSAADSLGAYLTYAPAQGRRDSERNCISNIHPEGLPVELAAYKLAWLAREALRRRYSGIELKEAAGVPELQAGSGPQPLSFG